MKIHTGADIISKSIKEFNVVNGCWHGIVTNENGVYTLHAGNKSYCTDKFHEVSSFKFDETTVLDLEITDISFMNETSNLSLQEKFNLFDNLYQNGISFEQALEASGLTLIDIGDKEDFKILADFNKSFNDLVEAFPETKDKLNILNLQLDILTKIKERSNC